MWNPFEKFSSRREEHEETESKLKKDKQEIRGMKPPKRDIAPGDLFSAVVFDTTQAINAVKNLPRKKMLEMRIKSAEKKLREVYERDQEEATRLNEQYNEIIKKSVETGDDTERTRFERDFLGMKEVGDE